MKHFAFLVVFCLLFSVSPHTARAQDPSDEKKGAEGFDCKGDPKCALQENGDGAAVVVTRKQTLGADGKPIHCCDTQMSPAARDDDTTPDDETPIAQPGAGVDGV